VACFASVLSEPERLNTTLEEYIFIPRHMIFANSAVAPLSSNVW